MLCVLDSHAVFLKGFAFSWHWSGTVLANIDVGADSIEEVGCNELLAGRMGDSIVVSILPNISGISSIATSTILTVHNNLRTKSNRSRGAKPIQNIEAICERRCGALHPAISAVTWNVLVLAP